MDKTFATPGSSLTRYTSRSFLLIQRDQQFVSSYFSGSAFPLPRDESDDTSRSSFSTFRASFLSLLTSFTHSLCAYGVSLIRIVFHAFFHQTRRILARLTATHDCRTHNPFIVRKSCTLSIANQDYGRLKASARCTRERLFSRPVGIQC